MGVHIPMPKGVGDTITPSKEKAEVTILREGRFFLITLPSKLGIAEGIGEGEVLALKVPTKEEDENKQRFLSKVYMILSVQLLFTYIFIINFHAFRLANPEVGNTQMWGWWLSFAALFSIIIIFLMVGVEKLRTFFPLNYICLGVYTLSNATFLEADAASCTKEGLYISLAATAILCAVVTHLGIKSKWDVSGYLLSLFIALVTFILMLGLKEKYHLLNHLIPNVLGVLLVSTHFVYDTQHMVAGRPPTRGKVPYREHVYEAVKLYFIIFIIMMFMFSIPRAFTRNHEPTPGNWTEPTGSRLRLRRPFML